MVVDQLPPDEVDRIFHALADATRRDILRQVMISESSVSALARHYPVSLTAVQTHVAVQEEAGLVSKERRGREQRVRPEIGAVRRAMQLLEQYEAVWRGRVDRMSALLDDDEGVTP
jgi:DNA-binding transcriptional ArsR family regulator